MNKTTDFTKQISDLIRERYSCRTYSGAPIEIGRLKLLVNFSNSCQVGPFGSTTRFKVVAASEGDDKALKGLGTYGFINNAPGYIIGATQDGEKNLEDFGYLMEKIILYATDLGLGTCWLGGTFTRSKFAEKISLGDEEIIPAVTAVGYADAKPRGIDQRIRKAAKSDQRLPWSELFFDKDTSTPLGEQDAGEYQSLLEMVRLGPSASNKQPWRIVRGNKAWHFYLLRTPGYRNNPYIAKMKIADLQRIDMGIAMSHFELAAEEMGLEGSWKILEPEDRPSTQGLEYSFSWVY
jgi:nitroreductase